MQKAMAMGSIEIGKRDDVTWRGQKYYEVTRDSQAKIDAHITSNLSLESIWAGIAIISSFSLSLLFYPEL